jgi:hypothetical protein
MPSPDELRTLLSSPNESLSIEYKGWLDIRANRDRATLAKAAIAIANHGGGIIVIGMGVDSAHPGPLQSQLRPAAIERYTQDAVNAAVNRFADPQLHCELLFAVHPDSGVEHGFVIVPGGLAVPVMSTREVQGVISAQRCYIRKPGPSSEEPYTAEEWRSLLERCVRAGRADMLDAIRAIVQGRAGTTPEQPARSALTEFVERCRVRWQELTTALPEGSPGKLPHGHYELAFEILGAAPAPNLAELRRRMETAGATKHTGWGPFVLLHRAPLAPVPVVNGIEAWLGVPEDRVFSTPAHSDFWRAEPAGRLFLLRGFDEDSRSDIVSPGTAFDITLPVWRVGEAMLYVERLARTFGEDLSFITRCRYVGIRGRVFTSLDRRRWLLDERRAADDDVSVETQATCAEVRDNLVEVVHQLLTPVYERFGFWELSERLVAEELERLTSGRF